MSSSEGTFRLDRVETDRLLSHFEPDTPEHAYVLANHLLPPDVDYRQMTPAQLTQDAEDRLRRSSDAECNDLDARRLILEAAFLNQRAIERSRVPYSNIELISGLPSLKAMYEGRADDELMVWFASRYVNVIDEMEATRGFLPDNMKNARANILKSSTEIAEGKTFSPEKLYEEIEFALFFNTQRYDLSDWFDKNEEPILWELRRRN